ncbi:cysteine hydrolase family protein [Enterococcus devriesei]|uniref:cysteine hydrolase family protein n=1 Tax=Enterococcus devriesei TaxID=319970 RepID=UPI0028A5FA0F|nr:cysteine hydrolase family protein [Enterococcus devriesei]
MPKLSDALLVIDLQKGVCFKEEPIYHLDELISNINQRIIDYRQANKTVVFIQHCDEELIPHTEAWELLTELAIAITDPIIQKNHANAFYHTKLQATLTEKDCHSLEVCGAQTEYCIDTTIKFAHGLGYPLTMKKNFSTTYDHSFLSAANTIAFYEKIWNKRFLQLL